MTYYDIDVYNISYDYVDCYVSGLDGTYGKKRTIEWEILDLSNGSSTYDSGSFTISAYSEDFEWSIYDLEPDNRYRIWAYIYNPSGTLLAQCTSSAFYTESEPDPEGFNSTVDYGSGSSTGTTYLSIDLDHGARIGYYDFYASENGTLECYFNYDYSYKSCCFISYRSSWDWSYLETSGKYAITDYEVRDYNSYSPSVLLDVSAGTWYRISFCPYYWDDYMIGTMEITYTPAISSWQSPVQMASISGSSYSSYSATTTIDAYRAGYVRFYAPANGQVTFQTTSNSTSPDYYSYLSTSTLSAGSGTSRSSAVTGYLTSDDDSGTSYDTLITYTVSAGNYYYWYVNAAWSSSGTYSIPWSLTYKRAYTITYNANNGSGAPSTGTYYAQSTPFSATLSSTVPTRTGYTFLGWSTSSSATTASYSAGGTISLSGSITLYAVWRINSYTISYNANAGIDTTKNIPSSQTKNYGTALTLSTLVPLRYGYTFQGWATTSSATSATYQPGASFTTNATTTLYAVWAINTYAVSFNANGGTGAPSSFVKTYGTVSTIPTTVPTRSGYTFLGWSTDSAAIIVSYQPGDSYDIDLTTTLYAVWSSDSVVEDIGKRLVFYKGTKYPTHVYLGSVEQLVWLNWDIGE